jgi:hypothetical protein
MHCHPSYFPPQRDTDLFIFYIRTKWSFVKHYNTACRLSKRRCDLSDPCARCVKRGYQCIRGDKKTWPPNISAVRKRDLELGHQTSNIKSRKRGRVASSSSSGTKTLMQHQAQQKVKLRDEAVAKNLKDCERNVDSSSLARPYFRKPILMCFLCASPVVNIRQPMQSFDGSLQYMCFNCTAVSSGTWGAPANPGARVIPMVGIPRPLGSFPLAPVSLGPEQQQQQQRPMEDLYPPSGLLPPPAVTVANAASEHTVAQLSQQTRDHIASYLRMLSASKTIR